MNYGPYTHTHKHERPYNSSYFPECILTPVSIHRDESEKRDISLFMLSVMVYA